MASDSLLHLQPRTWPSPKTIHLVLVSSRRPQGPRAWNLSVLMPISAPRPSWPPSLNRVLALTITAELSTSATNRCAAARSLVTIASVWPEPCRVMWAIASSIESTTATARILSRYSVSQSAGSAAFMAGTILRAIGSPRSSTPSRDQGLGRPGQEDRGDRAMDEQRLGRVADARALDLGVDDDLDRHVEVAAGIDVDVAVALVVLQDRHLRLGDDAADQALAAARDGQVDELGQAQQLADGRAVDRRDELDRLLGQAAAGPARRPGSRCRARLVWIASLPPRRITALPLLTQSAAASTVTLGRLS